MSTPNPPATNSTTSEDRLLCLTILGYRKQGMSEEAYRKHMIEHSAPLTKDLMIKYGILRWTVIHNPTETRELMYEIMDPQMANIADYDCFSQVVFRNFEDYKKIKDDPWYKEHLVGDHENFADTKRSKMTIGWITQFIDRGVVTEGFEGFPGPKNPGFIPTTQCVPSDSEINHHRAAGFSQTNSFILHISASSNLSANIKYSLIMASLTTLKNTAIVTGSFLSGAMITLSTITVPVLLETSTHPPQLLHQWVRTYHYGHISLPTISIATAILYFYIAAYQGAREQPWRKAALVGFLTIVMVPFTWIVMSSTNGMLFGLEAGNRDHSQFFEQGANRSGLKGANSSQSHGLGNVSVGIGVEMATLEGVRELLVRWKWMHLVRSLFPLMAAVLGVGICV